jgi:hypothetical protein
MPIDDADDEGGMDPERFAGRQGDPARGQSHRNHDAHGRGQEHVFYVTSIRR